jgi:hypothetical protein
MFLKVNTVDDRVLEVVVGAVGAALLAESLFRPIPDRRAV